MGHDKYLELTKRLNKVPQGAPLSDTLLDILQILFTEEEADLISKIPIKFCTVKNVAKIWKKSEEETEKILNTLADKGIMLDLEDDGVRTFTLAPPMAGFLEFSLMRTDGRFDRKVLSELYHQYINVEREFGTMLWALEPAIDRCLVNENAIQEKHESMILDYERATNIIETASLITVGTCYCRHKMEHMGKACDMPQEVCLTFNSSAKTLSKHGIAKIISKEEALRILDETRELGLVQIGDNVQENVNWICNCCSCCCEALLGYKEFGYIQNIQTNFYAHVNEDECTGCGICEDRCPVDAIKVNGVSKVDLDRCIGCGVCTQFCDSESILLEKRENIQFVPKDSFERIVIEAINTGKLHNLIFDNFTSISNKVMNRMLKIFFSVPFVNHSLIENQLNSRYLTSMFKVYKKFNKKKVNGFNLDYYQHPEMKN